MRRGELLVRACGGRGGRRAIYLGDEAVSGESEDWRGGCWWHLNGSEV